MEALKHNLAKLKLTERCTVLEGDNRQVCPKRVADRVNLGLIPESVISWRTACEALRDVGGTLHIHGNVECAKQQNKMNQLNQWAENVRSDIEGLINEVKRAEYKVNLLHVECVKSYAPRVYHAVADIHCVRL